MTAPKRNVPKPPPIPKAPKKIVHIPKTENPDKTLIEALIHWHKIKPAIDYSRTVEMKGTSKGGRSYTKKFKYPELDHIDKLIQPALIECGLCYAHLPEGERVVCRVSHVSGEFMEGFLNIPTTGSMQDTGAAITYARRYTLTALLGITAGEDTDGPAPATPIAPEEINPQYVLSPERFSKFIEGVSTGELDPAEAENMGFILTDDQKVVLAKTIG